MSSTKMESKGQGDFELWHDMWQIPTFYYTKTDPKTLLELWQQGYFLDLWHYAHQAKPAAKFLELGSGRGTTSMYLLERRCDVTLVDLSPNAFTLAKLCCDQHQLPYPTFIHADVRDTKLPENSYDFIYNIGLLEHFDDPKPILDESYRLLKPGGLVFMVIVPDLSLWRKVWVRGWAHPWLAIKATLSYLVKKVFQKDYTDNRQMTRTAYSRSYYQEYAQSAGFQEAHCIPYNPYYRLYDQNRPFLKNRIEFPLFLTQFERTKKSGEYPLLKTSNRLAFCDLLLAWKS